MTTSMTDRNDKPAVALGPRIVASGGFTSLYREGMALIEDVAAYLDGDGRTESRGLPREASFVYATESMRLTTRLMQLASWLLLQRAVNEGEITAENARAEKEKVKFSATPSERGGPGFVGPARPAAATTSPRATGCSTASSSSTSSSAAASPRRRRHRAPKARSATSSPG